MAKTGPRLATKIKKKHNRFV